jgi:hypothetical protein
LRMPKFDISPINGPPVLEKARVNPQKVHWKVTIAMTVSDWKIIARALLRLVIPP